MDSSLFTPRSRRAPSRPHARTKWDGRDSRPTGWGSASVEAGVAGAVRQQGLDAVREVLCLEQGRAGACGQRVGRYQSLLAVSEQQSLGDVVGACRAGGEPVCECK